MKSQITLLIVRAVLSAGISLSQQPQAAAASVGDEVRQMCHSDVTTDEIVAGASKVVSIVPAVFSVPVSIPRVPIGLGSLTLEAEALDRAGRQQAVMIWARGADSFTTSPRVSKAGDAYDLATKFGADVSELLVSGNAPLGKMPRAPSLQKINASLGGKPTQAACEMFGRDPGLAGAIAAGIGLPPEWSDDGMHRRPVVGEQIE